MLVNMKLGHLSKGHIGQAVWLAYRVAGLSCPGAGSCKSTILRGFPDVFRLFGPCKVGEISFRHSWTTGMKKKSEILP